MINKDFILVYNEGKIEYEGGRFYEDKNYFILSNSQILDLNNKNLSLKKVISFYKNKCELSNIISNLFSIVIIDKINNKIFLTQDINGDSVPIYYYKNNELIVVSNSLLNILNYVKEEVTLNKISVEYFIKKGYIPNKNTLINNIFKLVPKYNLYIDLKNNKDYLVKKRIKYKRLKTQLNKLYIDKFNKIIKTNEKNKDSFITLSKGYDSNFILSFLNKDKDIHAFSVGGIVGQDETKVVEKNVKNYKNVNLTTSYVDTNTLNNYPDLVYRLEGAMYERGIFLQYELMKLVKNFNEKNKVLFAGEGADQVFSYEYYSKLYNPLKLIKYLLVSLKNFNYIDEISNILCKGGFLYKNHAFNFNSYLILKKNGILMNSESINCVYPFLNKNIIDIGYNNRFKNFFNKTSHIKACKEIILPSIMNNVIKLGGTTEPIALFKYCSYMKDLEEYVKSSKFNIMNIRKKEITSNNYLNYVLKVLYLEIFEYLFIMDNKNIVINKELSLIELLKKKHNI